MTVNSHEQQLERLRGLQHHAAAGGGDKAVARHHEAGKLTARERLDRLFDRNTFIELNDLAESQCTDFGMDRRKVPGDGVVVGHGLIDGRRVFAYAQDVTVLGGSVGTIHGQKICRILDEASRSRSRWWGCSTRGAAGSTKDFSPPKGWQACFTGTRPRPA